MANPKASMPPPSSPASRGSISAVSDRLSEASVAATVKSDAFPTGAKQEIRALARDECWACTTTLPQACHVMAKAHTQVKKWYDAGLVTSKLTSSSNGIALCPTCHARFNNLNDPGYLFYPEDLDFFIGFELHDQLLREELPRPRNVPTAKEYKLQQIRQGRVSADYIGGLYQPVLLDNFLVGGKLPNDILSDLTSPKPWHGNPILTFRKAFLVLGGVSVTALDPESCNKLEKLRDLYFRPSIQRHDFSNREQKRKADISGDDENLPKKQKNEGPPSTQAPSAGWTYGPNFTSQTASHRYAQLRSEAVEVT